MFIAFYTVKLVYICVLITCFTMYCLCDTHINPWNMCVCVCVHTCLCAYAHVCMYVCVCGYVWIYACMNVCMDAWMHAWMHVCARVCFHVCSYVFTRVCMQAFYCIWSILYAITVPHTACVLKWSIPVIHFHLDRFVLW
jgi:hypothetical protein